MNKHVIAQTQSPRLRDRHRCRRRRAYARPRYSLWRTDRGSRRRRLARGQRLGGDPPRRYRRDPHRPLGNGPGHAHRPRPTRRRRTRMRLVEGHHRISDARPKRRPQARMGRFFDRRQPRHPHQPGICPQGRRHRAHDAGPGRRQRMEGAGLGMHRGQQRHHPRGVGQDHDLRQGGGSRGQDSSRPRSRGQAEGSQGLEDRRQGREAARHRRQDHRQDDLRHRRQAAGHAQRRDQGVSGLRRQAEELRRSQGHGHEGRQEGGEGRRQRGRRRRRYLVARQDRARSAADCLGRRRQRQGLQRVDREMARRRSRQCPAGLYRQPERRRQGGDCRRRQEGRGGLQLSLPEPRHDGAAQRDGALDVRQMRGLVRHAKRRSGVCRDAGGFRAVRPTNATCTSRCWAAASAAAARPTMSGRRF